MLPWLSPHTLLALAVSLGGTDGQARSAAADLACPDLRFGHAARAVPAPDLHCVELSPSDRAPEARGRVTLLPGDSPFTVTVDRDGVLHTRFRVEVAGLPDPADMGARRYVLWLTPPTLDRFQRLGEVANGTTLLGEGGFNQYLLWVSAEGDEVGDDPSGPLVLRGSSPSMVLRPHDLPFLVAEMAGEAALRAGNEGHDHAPGAPGAGAPVIPDTLAPPAPHDRGHAAHATHGSHTGEGLVPVPWSPPPMHPEVVMPHALMALRPGVAGGFPPFPEGLPEARPPERVRLADGDTLHLEAGPLLRRVGHLRVPGFGYNGQIPGPVVEVEEGSRIHVDFENATPLPTAVHWHGLRLENAFDGVPGVTQDPIPPGGRFAYQLDFPDEGTYWYHPHLQEVVAKDLGLAGTLHVRPAGSNDPYAQVDRELHLVLDDHLVGPDGPVPYGITAPVQALMGRFGNVLLVNGEADWRVEARPGEVLRLHLVNAAGTRTFNLSLGDLPLKLVGGDVGRLPREQWVENVVLAPAERWVVEVQIPQAEGEADPEAGTLHLENRVQALDHMGARFIPQRQRLGTVRIAGEPLDEERAAAARHPILQIHEALAEEVAALADRYRGTPPRHTLELALRTGDLPFPLDPLLRWEGAWRPPVEWEGTMPEMDWLATGDHVAWVLRDPATGLENMAIDWRFQVGDRIVLRLVNDRDGVHPMQHPIHVHGQRMLVLSVNGEPHPDPTWKDTVLVPVGQVVDVLVEMSNPGSWMIHCHIAEHMETGMMAIFQVGGGPGPWVRAEP